MKTEELIVALAGAAGPVHRLPRPAIRLWRWAIVTAGVAAIAILTFGWRADLVDVLGQPAFLGLVITAVGATGLAATAAFHLSVPGAERSRLPRRLAWLAVAAWLVMNAIGLMAGAEHPALAFFVIAAVAGKGRMTAWQARPPRASSGPDAA